MGSRLGPPPDQAVASAAERDRWIRKNRYYYDAIAAFVGRTIPPRSRVLQLGCDLGQLLGRLDRPARVLGVDGGADRIALAQAQHPHIGFVAADPEEFVSDERFDWIVVADAVGGFTDVQLVLEHARRMLAPDGRLLVSYYNWLWEPILGAAEIFGQKMRQRPQNWLPDAGLQTLLDLTDLGIVRRGDLLLVPRNIPFVSSILNRLLAPLPLIRRLTLVEYVVARALPAAPEALPVTCSVIVPCRNEAGTIARLVDRVPPLGSRTQIVLIEGHSRDNTLAECRRVQQVHADKDILVLTQPGIGKADAVRAGIAAASGDILLILDADLSVAPEELVRFYRALVSGKGELANGTRLVYPVEREAMRYLNRLANRAFAIAFSWLLGQRITDTLCGTKAFRRSTYDRIIAATQDSIDPFGDFDLLVGAATLDLRIVEVPVRYHVRTYGATNISRFRHGFQLLQLLWRSARKLKFSG